MKSDDLEYQVIAMLAQGTLSGEAQSNWPHSLLQPVLDASPSVVIVKDLKGKFLVCNKAFALQFGVEPSGMVGRTLFDIFPKNVAAEMTARDNEVIVTRKAVAFEELIPLDTGSRWHLVSLFPLKDKAGQVYAVGAIVTDIHDVKSLKGEIDAEQRKSKNIIEAMQEGLAIYDSAGKICYMNSAAADLLESSETVLLESKSSDFSWDVWREDGTALLKSEFPSVVALRDGVRVKNFRMGIQLPSGKIRWLSVNAFPIQEEGESERSVVVTFADISEVFEVNAQLDDFFNSSLDLICIANTDGFFKRVNPSFTRILGYSNQELLNSQFMTFIHPDDFAATADVVKSLADGKVLLNFENRCRTKAGEYRIIQWHCQPNERTGDLYATGRDVTSQRKAEKGLNSFINSLNASAIVAFTDAAGVITEVNDNFCRISGYTREELLGNTHRIVNSDEHPPAFFRDMWKRIRSGSTWTGDIKNRRKDGTYYWVRSSISPIFDADRKISQYVAIRYDITEQKEMEVELELERAKSIRNAKLASMGEMSAGVAHEINNPLAIIHGTARILTKFIDDPDKLRHRISVIQDASDRIAKIVSSLKKFSRSDDHSTHVRHNLLSIISESIVLTGAKSRRHTTPVEVNCHSGCAIICDEIEIEQVLVNMINNGIDAVKNLKDRWVKIDVFEDGNFVSMKIRDSGRGISPEICKKIYDPFFTTKEIGSGTGLGLSIVKGILDEHRATIELLDKDPNTCFEIRFPRVEDPKHFI